MIGPTLTPSREEKPMTIKGRIRKLEQRGEQQPPLIGGRTQAEWKWIRAERMRLFNDPEALERLRQEAFREDQERTAAETTAGDSQRLAQLIRHLIEDFLYLASHESFPQIVKHDGY